MNIPSDKELQTRLTFLKGMIKATSHGEQAIVAKASQIDATQQAAATKFDNKFDNRFGTDRDCNGILLKTDTTITKETK